MNSYDNVTAILSNEFSDVLKKLGEKKERDKKTILIHNSSFFINLEDLLVRSGLDSIKMKIEGGSLNSAEVVDALEPIVGYLKKTGYSTDLFLWLPEKARCTTACDKYNDYELTIRRKKSFFERLL